MLLLIEVFLQSKTVPSLSLSFTTLMLLSEKPGKLFWRMSLTLGLSDVFSRLDGGCALLGRMHRDSVPFPVPQAGGTWCWYLSTGDGYFDLG